MTIRQRVLITGGAGFIGTALSSVLTTDHEITVLDNLHPQVHGAIEEPPVLTAGVRFVRGDVRDLDLMTSLVREVRPTVVVHLAAETGTGQSLSDATAHASTNVVGTATLLDALWKLDVRPEHLLLTSSRAVYGEGSWDQGGRIVYPPPRSHADLSAARWDPCGDDGEPATPRRSIAGSTEPRPCNVYGATKLAQEHICTAWTASTGTRLSILRLQNVYGPGQSLQNPYTGVVSLFAQLALAGEKIDLYEDGKMLRDFVFIDDVVAALHAAIRRPPAGHRVVDIGSGVPVTLEQVAHTLAKAEDAPTPRVSGRFRDGDVRAACCDISAARDELHYEPGWDLERGLSALLRWVSQERSDPAGGDAATENT